MRKQVLSFVRYASGSILTSFSLLGYLPYEESHRARRHQLRMVASVLATS